MRDRIIQRARRAMARTLRTRHQQIYPRPVQGLFNFRCHENCVQWLYDHSDQGLRIAEAIYLDEGEPALHYLVFDPADSSYLEVTLGWRTEQCEYFAIRLLDVRDHLNIHHEFDRSLDDWTEEYVPWFIRKLFGIKRVL